MSEARLTPIQFGTQEAEHRSHTLAHELCENLYLEASPQGAKHPYVLIGSPGLKLFTTAGDGPIRGIHMMGPYVYVVSGPSVYAVDAAGAVDLLGTIEGNGIVQMSDNGTHVWIATGGILYAVNFDEVLEVPNGAGITDVTYQDGFLMGVVRGTQSLFISGLDDATTIDGLDLTTVDTNPDLVVGVISDHREPLVFKERTIEAFFNTGASAFPFSRTQVVERGCVSAASIAKAQNMVFWLGDDLLVYRMAGYQPELISTPAVADMIADQSSPQTAEGFTYTQGGHTFYVLTVGDLTLCFDLGTGMWSRRRSDGMGRWRVQGQEWAASWRKNLVGDFESGNLYELDLDTYDENGAVLRARATGATLWNSGHRFILDELFADFDAGGGLVTGQGSDPQVCLDWSDDGGRTWSSELWRSFGKIGEYLVVAKWVGLGAHRNMTPRLTITDPVPRRLMGVYVRMTGLSS